MKRWVRTHKAKPRAAGQSLDCLNWEPDSPLAAQFKGSLEEFMDFLREREARDIHVGEEGHVVVIFKGPRYGERMEVWEAVEK